MSASDMIAELPTLSHGERRALARRIFELEADAQVLAECDRRADANFQLLDAMEANDAQRHPAR